MGQVVIYCRGSTDDQCCERERDLRAFADSRRPPGRWRLHGKGFRARNDRQERRKVLAQARQIDAVLVTELSRWGRNTKDLLETLDELHDRGVSVLPLNGQSFDIDSANGRLMRTLIAALAEFEHDLIKERVKSGLAQVKATFDKDGHFITESDKVRKKLGRKYGYRLSDRYTKNVLEMHGRRQLPPDRPQP